MRRKVALSLFLVASAGVTVPWIFRVSALRSLELLTLHLLLLVDMLVQPPADGANRDDPKRVMWGRLLILALVYLPLVYSISPATASSALVWSESLGLVITMVGAVLALWGRICLGRMATTILTIVEGHSLRKEGPYQVIRHPIYSGFALAFFGHQVAFLFLPGLVAWYLFVAFYLHKRIQVEEEMLLQQFGGDYLDYQQHTWRMFPYLY